MSEEGVVNILEDQEHVDFLYGEDVDEDPVTFHIVMEPSHGIITLSDDDQGQYTYVPDLNYFGTDSFSYSVSDGDIFSDTSMVYVSVFGVNDAPVIEIIEDQSILEDDTLQYVLSSEEFDGDSIIYDGNIQIQNSNY